MTGRHKRALRGDGALTAADLAADPELRKAIEKKLGKKVRKPRTVKFTAHQVQRYALRVMAVIADLSREHRTRVLKHAMQINGLTVKQSKGATFDLDAEE